MADFLTKVQRSERMSLIRSRGNRRTELALIKLFKQHHIIGWQRHQKLPGRPDFIFRKLKIALFVDGCFWHGCPKHSAHVAKSGDYWLQKIKNNKARDQRTRRILRKLGWQVICIWEHELARKSQDRCMRRIREAIASRETSYSPLKTTSR